MFLDELRLRNVETDEVFRVVKFHLGANLVVDAEDSAIHNKAGKTTFLKLLDVLMGAKDRKNLYHDDETNSDAVELMEFIGENRICASLSLKKDFFNNGTDCYLEVDLFPRGSYRINGNKMSQQDYRIELNKLLFSNNANIPTFRQLINSFVRVSMSGDNDSFLKSIPNAGNAIYRSVYNYLFDISDPSLDKELGDLKATKKRIDEAHKQFVRLNNAGNTLEEQQQMLVAVKREYGVITQQMEDMLDSRDFEKNRNHIADIRVQYTQLMNNIADLRYRIERNEQALSSARKELSDSPDPSLAEQFYEEVKELIPGVLRTYDELIAFNRKLSDNKIQYYEKLSAQLKNELYDLENKKAAFLTDNKRFMSLIANDDLSKYEILANRRDALSQEIGKIEEAISATEQFYSEKKALQERIDELEKKDLVINYQEVMDGFNAIFTSLAQEINGERPVLVYYPDSKDFPVAIRELAGTSTGTRKSLIAAYDLAYQIFAREIGKTVPKFVVHDVLENIEGDNLREIFFKADESGSQYIVAVLKEKIDSSGIDADFYSSHVALVLSTNDRLFEGKKHSEKNHMQSK